MHAVPFANTIKINSCNVIIIIIKKRLAMQGWERAINTLSVRRPNPATSTYRMKEEKGKTGGDKK